MNRFGLACVASLLLSTAACNGDDDNGSDTNTAMTFAMTVADDGGVTMGDDGMDTTAGDDAMSDDSTGAATGPGDTAADSESGPATTAGTDDGGPVLPTCQHQCTTPQDCFIDGEETGLACNAGMCSIACVDDPQCVAASSGWTLVPCTGDGDCSGGVCVDTGAGVGGCSLQPSQGACSDANLVEMMATALGGGMVTVCGQPNALCTPFGGQNICIVGCAGNACLGELACEADGLCHCEFDTQCVDAGTGNNCNAEGLCEFTCTGAADCPGHPFDGGMLACQ